MIAGGQADELIDGGGKREEEYCSLRDAWKKEKESW